MVDNATATAGAAGVVAFVAVVVTGAGIVAGAGVYTFLAFLITLAITYCVDVWVFEVDT